MEDDRGAEEADAEDGPVGEAEAREGRGREDEESRAGNDEPERHPPGGAGEVGARGEDAEAEEERPEAGEKPDERRPGRGEAHADRRAREEARHELPDDLPRVPAGEAVPAPGVAGGDDRGVDRDVQERDGEPPAEEARRVALRDEPRLEPPAKEAERPREGDRQRPIATEDLPLGDLHVDLLDPLESLGDVHGGKITLRYRVVKPAPGTARASGPSPP